MGGGVHPIAYDQAPVRARDGALPGIEEEHGTAEDAVRAVQPVDGEEQVASAAGMSAQAGCRMAATSAEVLCLVTSAGRSANPRRRESQQIDLAP